jgi:hypothetical protein
LKEGHWLLLDEINLASSETLERLGAVLESTTGSVSLLERGDVEAIPRHPVCLRCHFFFLSFAFFLMKYVVFRFRIFVSLAT